MAKRKPNQRKQQAYEQALIDQLERESETFRRQHRAIRECFPEAKVTAIRKLADRS